MTSVVSKMKIIIEGLFVLGLAVCWASDHVPTQHCPAQFHPPEECFSIDDVKDYGPKSTQIESLYNSYLNLLTEADYTIHGDEPGESFFFGGELSQKLRKLKYFGNSAITFLEIALHHICRERDITGEQLIYCLNQLNVTADYFEVCEQYDTVDCNERVTSYQPLDGICVHFDEPYKGAANTPYKRLLKNSYKDSIHEVRTGTHDNDLPSTRLISSSLRSLYYPIYFDSPDNLPNDLTLMFASEVIHDITKTLKAQTWAGNFGFECCECGGKTKISDRFANRHCMPIKIPERDPIFRGQHCMNYIRAMVTHDDCKIKEAQILNAVTHFMDMSFLYAPDNVAAALKNGGKFKEGEFDIHRTIILGEERSAQFPQFYALVVVWIKFHNRVFDDFTMLYPKLSKNVLFYETRRFLIACFQNIFYSEVLPLLISSRSMAKYRLASRKPCYDPEINPSVTAEFTSSAARYYHNFIHEGYIVNFKNGTSAEILLRDLKDENLGFTELRGVITGAMNRPWNTEKISSEMSNYLFSPGNDPGLDLRAIDLQTERDFGIGTYCDALYYFNITEGECVKRFSDFEPFISDENLEFLKYAYDGPCDTDLGVGGMMHSSEDGDVLSDIFDRVFASQFKSLKCGDPFFFSNALEHDQITFLEHILYRDILCLTVPDLKEAQPYVFMTPGEDNNIEACTSTLNLKDWKLTVDPNASDVTVPTNPPEDTTVFDLPDEPETTEAPIYSPSSPSPY